MFDSLFGGRRQPARRTRLGLEALEDRWLPAPVSGVEAPRLNAAVVANQQAAQGPHFEVVAKDGQRLTLQRVTAWKAGKPSRLGGPHVVVRKTDDTGWFHAAANRGDVLKAVPLAGGKVMYEFTGNKPLSYELQKIAPGGADRMQRVGDWLKANRGLINQVAREANIPPEAVAGAIAWEALQNAKKEGNFWGVLTLGPGKVHPDDENAGAQVEGQGMGLPKRNYWDRLNALKDPATSVRYVAAIMKYYADRYDEVHQGNNPTPLRADPGVLATLFQGVSVPKKDLPQGPHYNPGSGWGPMTAIRPGNAAAFFQMRMDHNQALKPNDQMGAWVNVHASFLRKAVAEDPVIVPIPVPAPTPAPVPTPTPPAQAKPTRDQLAGLWDAVSLTKNAVQYVWLSKQFGVGRDATAWLMRPKDGEDRADGKAWGWLATARGLIVEAMILFDTARTATGQEQTRLVHEGNDKLAQASPMVHDAESTWAALWADSLKRT